MTLAAQIKDLSYSAEHRTGVEGRRRDGAFFTDDDVAHWIVRRALGARLLAAAEVPAGAIDTLLATGANLHDAVARTADETTARTRMAETLTSLDVLDPTCGAGSFLRAAWHELCGFARILNCDEAVSLDQLHGIDMHPEAVAACSATFALIAPTAPGTIDIQIGDAERGGVLPAADIMVGNPPFVRATSGEQHRDLHTRSVPNRSAWIVERALAAARPGARAGFVLPISTTCTDAFAPARITWSSACDRIHACHFDAIPASLFAGVVQRISIFEGHVRAAPSTQPTAWWTSRYHRWLREERRVLLDDIRHVPLPGVGVHGSMAKVGTELEVRLLEQLFAHPPASRWLHPNDASVTTGTVLYKRRWSYYLLFTDFVPEMWDADGMLRPPTEMKALHVTGIDHRVLLAVYSSSLFWWYFSAFTDNRNVNRRDVEAFPIPELTSGARQRLAQLGSELMEALRDCAEIRTCTYRSIGTIRNTYFRQGATRPVLDRIDAELARAYDMTDAQRDFVIGFERRFRS